MQLKKWHFQGLRISSHPFGIKITFLWYEHVPSSTRFHQGLRKVTKLCKCGKSIQVPLVPSFIWGPKYSMLDHHLLVERTISGPLWEEAESCTLKLGQSTCKTQLCAAAQEPRCCNADVTSDPSAAPSVLSHVAPCLPCTSLSRLCAFLLLFLTWKVNLEDPPRSLVGLNFYNFSTWRMRFYPYRSVTKVHLWTFLIPLSAVQTSWGIHWARQELEALYFLFAQCHLGYCNFSLSPPKIFSLGGNQLNQSEIFVSCCESCDSCLLLCQESLSSFAFLSVASPQTQCCWLILPCQSELGRESSLNLVDLSSAPIAGQ